MLRLRNSGAGKSGRRDARQLAQELHRRVEDEARNRVTHMLDSFAALAPGWQAEIDNDAAYILEAGRLRQAIQDVMRQDKISDSQKLRFQASSLFLRDCHRTLTSDPNGHERLVIITGTTSPEGIRVLSRMVAVDMDNTSPAYVRGSPHATHKAIMELVERDGHQPLAMWHSHMMRGKHSTRPSGVDIANQERFCAIGWQEVIGGIFSLDGYFRAFSTARDFKLEVYGKGANIVSQRPRETIIKLDIEGRS